jgi:hypothetical protein
VKKIHTLKEKESYDFGLIGISSPENDYRITWILNNAFGFNLSRREDLEIYHKKLEGAQAFHQFEYHDEDTLLDYRLLSNKSEHGYLLEEMPNMDYLLQITGEWNEVVLNTLIGRIKLLEGIRLAVRIDPDLLKSKKKLLF